MTYHRIVEANEKVIRIPLGGSKEATLLFTQVHGSETWVCISTTETLDDLVRLLEDQCI